MVFADLKNDFVFRREYGAAQRAEGKAEGKAEAVLAVLETRGIALDREMRARIVACTDTATLARWLARAITAASAEEVIARTADERPTSSLRVESASPSWSHHASPRRPP